MEGNVSILERTVELFSKFSNCSQSLLRTFWALSRVMITCWFFLVNYSQDSWASSEFAGRSLRVDLTTRECQEIHKRVNCVRSAISFHDLHACAKEVPLPAVAARALMKTLEPSDCIGQFSKRTRRTLPQEIVLVDLSTGQALSPEVHAYFLCLSVP